jgi:hypothetical protein
MAKAIIVISLVFEKIYEKLSAVKKPSVVSEARINTVSNKTKIAVSQLLRTWTIFGKLGIINSSL